MSADPEEIQHGSVDGEKPLRVHGGYKPAALHGAAHIRSDANVQLLVDHGASINVADEKGITSLMIAEGGGHVLLPGLGGGSTADLLRALGGHRDVV